MNKVISNIAPSTGNPYVIPKESAGNISSETASEKSEASISLKTKRFESDVSEKENQIKRDCLANISGKLPVQFKTSVNVGFSKMPKQIYRKAIQRGFTFNIMLVGVTGLGKSTFLNTLFMTDIYNDEHPASWSIYTFNLFLLFMHTSLIFTEQCFYVLAVFLNNIALCQSGKYCYNY